MKKKIIVSTMAKKKHVMRNCRPGCDVRPRKYKMYGELNLRGTQWMREESGPKGDFSSSHQSKPSQLFVVCFVH